MIIRTTLVFVAAFILATSSEVADAQTYPVQARFEIDGKRVNRKFRILLYDNGMPIEPTVSADGKFYIPASSSEKVDVRFISGKHDLLYEGVYLKKLSGLLVFGVKNDLSAGQSTCRSGESLAAVYYLEFHPDDAEGTAMTITTCK